MILILTPRAAAANSIRSSLYCSFCAGGLLKYSSGLSHQSRIQIVSLAFSRATLTAHIYEQPSTYHLASLPSRWGAKDWKRCIWCLSRSEHSGVG